MEKNGKPNILRETFARISLGGKRLPSKRNKLQGTRPIAGSALLDAENIAVVPTGICRV